MQVIYGDILNSNADVIVHQVNCQGVMGKGLAKQIREAYPEVYEQYLYLCKEYKDYGCKTHELLGMTEIVRVGFNRFVANLFAQEYYGSGKKCYTDYDALRKCLATVNSEFAGKVVAVPYKLGCGLAGGNWDIVSKIIEETLTDCRVKIYRIK